MPSARSALSPRARLLGFIRRHGGPVLGSITATTSPSVVLTFDDGPDPDQTPQVLEALAEHRATATFFVLLTRVREQPELTRSLLAAGHEIALHGGDHRALTTFSGAEASSRLARARMELEAVTGTAVRWYRPPYGAQSPTSWRAVRRTGLVPVLWSGTLHDSAAVDAARRAAAADRAAAAGRIVLAHDGIADERDGVTDPPAPVADRVALTREFLRLCDNRGTRVRSLHDALAAGAAPVRTLELTTLRSRPVR
jgi:peptidoglycan/xylan/chitin deacetylase (PgdA/CDA1 family)